MRGMLVHHVVMLPDGVKSKLKVWEVGILEEELEEVTPPRVEPVESAKLEVELVEVDDDVMPGP